MGVDYGPRPEVGRKRVVVLGATEWEDGAVVEAALALLRIGLGPIAVLHAHRPGAEQLAGSAALLLELPVYALAPDPGSVRFHVARQRTRRLVSSQEPDHALLFEGPGWGGGEVRDYMEALETRSFRVRYVSRVPWPGELRWLGESMRQWEANREERRGAAALPGPVRTPTPTGAARGQRDDRTNTFPSGSLKTAEVPHSSVLGSWTNSTPRPESSR